MQVVFLQLLMDALSVVSWHTGMETNGNRWTLAM